MSNKSDATVHLKVQSQFLLIPSDENHSAKDFLKTLFVFHSFLYLCGEGVNVQLDKSRLGSGGQSYSYKVTPLRN